MQKKIKRIAHNAFSCVFLLAAWLGIIVGWIADWGTDGNMAGFAAWAIGLVSLGIWLYAQHR